MKKIILVFIYFILYSSILSYAYDEERATLNLANDFAKCSAYYFISEDDVKKTGNKELANQLMKTSEEAYDYSVTLSNIKVAKARMKLAIYDQRKEMNHDYSNISILTLKYGELCKELLESSDKRLQYWLNKKE